MVDDSKRRYRELCAAEQSMPIFSRDWWLDAVAGEQGWWATVLDRDGEVIGSLPFSSRNWKGFKFLVQPELTQTLGPWIRSIEAKRSRILAYEKDVMNGLIAQLPDFDHFAQNWHHTQTNWLPFYWHGFTQTTRYTYVLPDLSDEKFVWAGLSKNIRTDIRKASARFGLQIRTNTDLDPFLDLHHQTFVRQGRPLPYSDALVRRLHSACAARHCSRVFLAEDAEGRPHAGVYLVWDDNAAYYLMGGGDPQLRSSGATSLCMWEAIRFASTVTRSFDFEGSMIESIERFFRAFGAEQRPYSRIAKTPSRILRAGFAIRSVFPRQ